MEIGPFRDEIYIRYVNLSVGEILVQNKKFKVEHAGLEEDVATFVGGKPSYLGHDWKRSGAAPRARRDE